MLDPMLSLAFNMQSSKGVYALLLGSGVSQSAQIPTGWDIVLDLVRKLAQLQNEDCELDPEAWYIAKYGEGPDYSKLIHMVAKSPSERNLLLRSYFEPGEEEREQGWKLPQQAHKAIAQLVVNGYIRVIITTNFDRLLEDAIKEAGINPTIISTPNAVDGALPLIHSGCTIIKLHGDYLETSIKNTSDELKSYDRRMNRLLNRVFDEFGLIVCGWSADWDTALRAVFERCKSRRFTTYWATRSNPSVLAQGLIDLRSAQVIRIQNADLFFHELAEKVSALDDVNSPHPLSTKAAVASLKRYIVDDRDRIRLQDLIIQETNRLVTLLSTDNYPLNITLQNDEQFQEELIHRLHSYEATVETLQALMINGCYWGESVQEKIWIKCLERITNSMYTGETVTIWYTLRLYPALLLLYGGGIASIAAHRFSTLSSLLTKVKIKGYNLLDSEPLIFQLYSARVLEKDSAQLLTDRKVIYFTPFNDYLFKVLREPLKEFLPEDSEYEECFDKFEYLVGLVYADLYQKSSDEIWGPRGRFTWNWRRKNIPYQIEVEATTAGNDWEPLKTGLFDGKLDRFMIIKKAYDEFLKKGAY